MNLRSATPDDAAVLADIHAAAFEVPWSASAIAGLLADGFAFTAALAGQPAAFILCRTAAGEAEILTLAVAPPERRLGLGRALIDGALGEARARGASEIFLEVARSNAAALALYKACGFGKVGERAAYYRQGGDRGDALVLRRDL